MNRTTLDLSLGVGAITVPWWMQLTAGLELFIAIGGVVLVGFLVAISIREWKDK